MHVFVFVRRFGLTARIHIDTPGLSFLLVFHNRGKISRVFPCWRRSDFIGVLPGHFPLRIAGPVRRSYEIESSSADSGCSAQKNGPGSFC
ncbi:hypothetical protein F2Q68_00021003 [Brassica cretica]|uniref:Uncharacterized protein n=1 Tax=Brassica cretica TaxID=69181 RepID=A0A8S9FX69_BRACR|nr:hypothetical protein F2Q68_00021003 [Brassica cretica]